MLSRGTIATVVVLGGMIASAVAGSQLSQQSQQGLAERVRSGSREERAEVLAQIKAMDPRDADLELRTALIEELERANALEADSERLGVTFDGLENPEYVAELHRVVAALGDERAIPSLARAIGSFTLIRQLTDLGEQAAPAVLDVVTDPGSRSSQVNDGLRVLRLMVENRAARPLSEQMMARVRDAAEQRLTGHQYFTTLWYAIDLAAVLNDPELRQTLEGLATHSSHVFDRGVTDPELVDQTQERAKERLAGVRARPRLGDLHQ